MNTFGEVSCEEEIELFGDKYPDFFFHETPFNELAIAQEVYLIVGRRGSEKSSLAHYFGFQDRIDRAVLIDVDEPKFYQAAMLSISRVCGAEENPDISIGRMVDVWTLGIWSLLFHRFYDTNEDIAAASLILGRVDRTTLRDVLARLFEVLIGRIDKSGELSHALHEVLRDETVTKAQALILAHAKNKPVFIAIDTIERYQSSDTALMVSTAALVQASFWMNRKFAKHGIHVKTFVPSEIFPTLAERYSVNTSKYVQDELFLHWRPRSLVRLICWRLYRHLQAINAPRAHSLDDVQWNKFESVLHHAWEPHFGKTLENRVKVVEQTLVYLLRHTQMRPRQLIILCNDIAKRAQKNGTFPVFSPEIIVNSVWETESRLATEVINSYEGTYSAVGQIMDSLKGCPARFRGNLLDKLAPSTASHWPSNQYSPTSFRRLVAELGVVGRVRSIGKTVRVIEADFEYAVKDRLALHERDDCVIHPMFYKKLSVDVSELGMRVLPFPDHEDFAELRNGY
jgi:hypothetical protein